MRDYPNREDKLIHTYNSEIEGITYLKSVINIKPIKNEQYNQRLSRLINSGIELSICQYSLGHEFKAIRETVEQTITYYSRMDDNWSAYPTSVYDLVKLVSMAILIDVSDTAWRLLVEKWLKSGSYGHLLAKLLSYREVNLLQGPDVRVNKLFGPLFSCSNLDDDIEFLEELKTYSKKWYARHKSLHWYNSHDSENSLYFGYWAIEAAAIAKIRGVSLVDTKFGEYFPYGFFDLPEQLSTAKQKKPQTQQNSATRIAYPKLPKLTLDIGSAWINESQDRLGLITHDEALECAGTVYASKGASFESFIQSRHSALVKQMPWYKLVGAAKLRELPIGKANEQLMQGVWQGESETTSYLVYALAFDQYFLGLTFTFMAKEQTKYEPVIEQLLASIRYQ